MHFKLKFSKQFSFDFFEMFDLVLQFSIFSFFCFNFQFKFFVIYVKILMNRVN